jgi:DNA-directed RNA polymerase subunit RPC12/RpoP
MATTQSTLDLRCEWCNFAGGLSVVGEHVHLTNAQVAMEHVVGRCPECGQTTALAQWGRDLRFSYKAIEYKRMFRRSTWVAVYNVICAWCGSKATEPAEINVTVANPVSERFRYDLYGCQTCSKATAISYLGEVRTHCAVRDDVYRALWYLDPE